ncbi:hypothetical protein AARAC_001601 [Aspergillus arachidicola]|uniref:Uncharacterized protein n=1 Tax=Aspergillus arachidicola TaxID=656916 RepID=A0A2G7G5J2_9EURO|nr:hypothetical protein AARAC_001601 [Aspergillus arachidicola]
MRLLLVILLSLCTLAASTALPRNTRREADEVIEDYDPAPEMARGILLKPEPTLIV